MSGDRCQDGQAATFTSAPDKEDPPVTPSLEQALRRGSERPAAHQHVSRWSGRLNGLSTGGDHCGKCLGFVGQLAVFGQHLR